VSTPESRLPASKSQLIKLGKRLAAGTLTGDDLKLYRAVLNAYEHVQAGIVAELRATDWNGVLGAPAPPLLIVGRTKTLDTLAQKLRRTPEVQLPYVRDIAGVRIVGDLTLAQQTTIGEWLIERYGGRLVDRRREPLEGYRALHAVLTVAGIRVEVQVRTRLQHLWAETFERIADRWGRQIRYGDPPNEPSDAELGEERIDLEDRVRMIESLQRLSREAIEGIEVLRQTHGGASLAAVERQVERQLLETVTWFDDFSPG
jgi:ppGpp synthetase/RelA/SpoT-type nucleotidyltranferase